MNTESISALSAFFAEVEPLMTACIESDNTTCMHAIVEGSVDIFDAWVQQHGMDALKLAGTEFMISIPVTENTEDFVAVGEEDSDFKLRIQELLYHKAKGPQQLQKFVGLLEDGEATDLFSGFLMGEVLRRVLPPTPDAVEFLRNPS